MFEEALLESAKHAPGAQRSVSTAASVVLQAGLLAAFVMVPLLATQVVPELVNVRPPTWIAPLETPVQEPTHSGSTDGSGVVLESRTFAAPSTIPKLNRETPGADVPPAPISNINPTHGAGLPGILGTGPAPVVPENPAAKRPIVSVLQEGVVLTRVQPVYPRLAIENRIQGSVHVHAIIAANGNLEALQVLSGHPMLASAALDAVRQWRFRPYILNGKPIEVQTEVTVNFTLN
jgi:protein TonB